MYRRARWLEYYTKTKNMSYAEATAAIDPQILGRNVRTEWDQLSWKVKEEYQRRIDAVAAALESSSSLVDAKDDQDQENTGDEIEEDNN